MLVRDFWDAELNAHKAAKSGAATLSEEEIDRLVKEREQARFPSDYKTADRLRDTLEKHGVHLDTKENKWQAADGRSGPIGQVNISAAHAQKAARSGAAARRWRCWPTSTRGWAG